MIFVAGRHQLVSPSFYRGLSAHECDNAAQCKERLRSLVAGLVGSLDRVALLPARVGGCLAHDAHVCYRRSPSESRFMLGRADGN